MLGSGEMLALVLANQGKDAEAEAMNRRALAGSEKVLGSDHPGTLTMILLLPISIVSIVQSFRSSGPPESKT